MEISPPELSRVTESDVPDVPWMLSLPRIVVPLLTVNAVISLLQFACGRVRNPGPSGAARRSISVVWLRGAAMSCPCDTCESKNREESNSETNLSYAVTLTDQIDQNLNFRPDPKGEIPE
jgi:hypothetical protein